MFGANFWSDVWDYCNFGALKFGSFGSLQINCLAWNDNCFSYRNVFQNGVIALSKLVLKHPHIQNKNKNKTNKNIRSVCSNFTSMWYKCFVKQNVWRDFRIPMSALATVKRKSFNGQFTTKLNFPIGYFIWSLLKLTSQVKSLLIHYLISIWTSCW